MTDIAELGYKVDSSGLVEGTKALDDNAAAAEKVSGATDRLERDYQALARTVERSSSVLGDRLGGALDRIGTGTGSVITELQSLNRTNAEILASLGALDGRLASAASQAQAYGAAGAAAAASTAQVATASQQLEQQLAQQEARYRAVAQQAMAWSQGNQSANLSERALAEAAREAALGIDYKARAMAAAGSEQDRMAARARSLQEAEARATNEAQRAAAATEAQKINLQQLLGQIDPTVGALNRLAAMEERLERAHKAGLVNPAVFDQYQTKIDAMRASVLNATNAQNGMGMSARQLQNNLRMIPMQVTDITTSLISGQPAWMVAIQQGGQLKDAFGGIGPAANAVASYVLGLINPVTLATAALAAMALAAKQNQDQLFGFQRELIMSGQGALIGAAGFEELADNLDRLAGVSRGGAVAALTETAKAGRFAGEQFELVAGAAARMEASTGRSAAATVDAFEAIAKEPLEGLLKLNDAERFLTAAQLQRITTLREEGRSQEAANEAIRLYANHLNDVASRTEAVMPAMSKGWRDIKDDIGSAWSALGGFTNAVVDLAGEWGVLARLPRLSDVLGLGLAGGTLVKNLGLPSFTDALNGIAASVRGLPPLPKPIDENGALDPQTARDLAAVTQERATAEQAAAEAINAQVAGLDRASAKEAARLKIIAQYNRLAENDARHFDGSMQRLIAKAEADVDKQFNRRDGIGRRNGDDSAAQNVLAAAQRQIEANKQLVDTGIKVTESERQAMAIEQLLAKSKNTMTAATRAQLEAAKDDLLASGQKAVAYTKEKEAAEALARQQAILAQAGSNRDRANELDLLGMSGGSDGVAMLRRQLDIQREYQEELKRLGSRDVAQDKATWDLLAANADAFRNRELEKERAFQEQRLAMLGDWRLGAQVAWQNYAFDATNYNQQAQDAVQSTLSTTTSSIATQIDELIRGNQSLGDSFKNVAVDMGNAVIGALEQMAAQWLVYKAVQLAVGESTSSASANTLVGNAAATAAQAALAAYASTAAIPIVGPAMAPGAAQLALSATAPYVAAVAAAGAVGMAHDGIDSVPREGTWLLDKGERVLTAGTAAKMDATLDRIAASRAAGPGAGGNVYAPTINVNGDPDARTLAMVEQSVRRGMQQNYDRISSELTTGQGRVGKGLRRGNNVSRRVT
ncbi:TPA: phage tail length tape measure family protein [Stenotrophomonas maltophilia]|uniref:phage tail length tape measure family protein n=1 Tax=Stenotrophomonas sp. GD03680 TaxID=2975365 RepID=UPI0018D3C7BC|nr:phage tail length tape measure family protein [Stenotrophomonas sp. GD03680]MBH1593608.1 phage tail length tape measure family protein [Stenotrophomonas maltophilia]MDH2022495.1 phage tail length tape measure family protein [Stenotrophomonas sp. GD03680]HEL3748618.1 phage tail length tape measure family protein [Stenotrophomonas maltophilia]HEL7729632.1 phage tail length tape measure family protein [Stenotrophomonas maltophilia]